MSSNGTHHYQPFERRRPPLVISFKTVGGCVKLCWMCVKRKGGLKRGSGLGPSVPWQGDGGDLASSSLSCLPLTPSDPLLPSLILSSDDSKRPAPVFHSLCMGELHCIMFF